MVPKGNPLRTTIIAKPGKSEAAIFGRVFVNGARTMTPEVARHVLGLSFSGKDKARMHKLTAKNQEGRISLKELGELDSYVKVGDLLAILQSKARRALKA